MSKKKSAADLVKNCQARKAKNVDWYQKLHAEEQKYVDDVVKAIISNPNAALYLVAEQVIFELDIDRHPSTVTKTLKEMIKHAQAKREETCR